jgi:hypothetical protein
MPSRKVFNTNLLYLHLRAGGPGEDFRRNSGMITGQMCVKATECVMIKDLKTAVDILCSVAEDHARQDMPGMTHDSALETVGAFDTIANCKIAVSLRSDVNQLADILRLKLAVRIAKADPFEISLKASLKASPKGGAVTPVLCMLNKGYTPWIHGRKRLNNVGGVICTTVVDNNDHEWLIATSQI